MTITLRPIDRDNYEVIARLSSTLTPEEQRFVSHNAISILDAHYDSNLTVRGIYADDTPVGLVMWGWDANFGGRWWVIRLMTAKPHQGKGYGRQVLQTVIETVTAAGADALYISFVPANAVAERLYVSLGFTPTGEMIEGETVYKRVLKP
ncbi:MAG: GNAT family N-acetyltransferase [bacterium]|nr:GNAT family N-acetyltransferase [bacterium]